MKLTVKSSARHFLSFNKLRCARRRRIVLTKSMPPANGWGGTDALTATGTGCVVTALLITLFGLLQITDGVVTYLGLGSFGLDEANPLLTAIAGLLGLGGAIAAVKLCGLAFITYLFFDRHKMNSRWITATLASADTFYSWVVANNVSLVLAA